MDDLGEYHGNRYDQPDWKALRAMEREEGLSHARQGQIDVDTLSTGSVFRFHELESRRDGQLSQIDRCGEEELQRAEAEKSARAESLPKLAAWRDNAKAAYENEHRRVSDMESPSQRPGDQRPSSIALSGGTWVRVRRWLPGSLLLLVLLAIELPIYYQIILNWGDSVVMTILLATGAALIMLILPHLYGRWLRLWLENGRQTLGLVLLIGLAVLWLGFLLAVSVLRRDALIQPIRDAEGNIIGELSGNLGGLPTAILVITLLVFTAVLAAYLGYLHNPNDHRFKELRAKRDDLARVYQEAERSHERATAYARSVECFIDAADQRAADRRKDTLSGYAALEAAYLEGVVEGLADPEAADWAGRILRSRR